MRARQPSIADSLIAAGTLLDARYRIDAPVRRMATASIHVATHRNGSTAWLKLPITKAHGALLDREASVANTIGSPLLVRDDGTTPDGVPYLVLDPPEGESLASLRARARAGARLSLARVMTAGDALARVVASLHALGYVTGGLHEEDVLVFANGEIALLDLHALEPISGAGVAADVQHVVRVLSALLADVAEPGGAGRAAIEAALATTHVDVAALQLAWRVASPEPIATPTRIRPGSFADIPSSAGFDDLPAAHRAPAPHSTPLAMTAGRELETDPEGSMIGYLRSAVASVAPPSGARERVVLDDPLSNVRELPRLLRSARHPTHEPAARSRYGRLVGASLAALAGVLMVAAGVFALSPRAGAEQAPATTVALEAKTAAAAAASPPVALPPAVEPRAASVDPPAPAALAAPAVEDDLQLTTLLRSEAAPPGRDVLIDGAVVGKTPLSVAVPCGQHALQMVAGAPKQRVELPCGGESVVRYDAKGHWSLRSR
ncbi:MAG TPA: PEGA domain-containing protein [Labilithrix sp.]|nr:PEGA domain-containing protein [Labilithrix sp.]